ncbi:methylamine utilization protein [Alteromonas facilis]|uniref:methylamine utilization protein n=1 Tax=Alteromonas facilis TaxID=2048004 RepID=UPI000C28B5EB|nr:methylamine utilization protein [Alteromonas facilis]
MRITFLRMASVICALMLANLANAIEQPVLVVDQNGNPVINAVIAFKALPSEVDNTGVAIMDQINKQFSPQVIAIQKGQAVKFPNSDDIRHHVYSFSAIKPFEIKLYKGSNVDPIIFDKPGIGILGCNIHDQMTGHVYVADNEHVAVTNEKGVATFVRDIPDEVSVWHSDLSIDGTHKITATIDRSDAGAIVHITLIERKPKEEQRTFGKRTFGRQN